MKKIDLAEEEFPTPTSNFDKLLSELQARVEINDKKEEEKLQEQRILELDRIKSLEKRRSIAKIILAIGLALIVIGYYHSVGELDLFFRFILRNNILILGFFVFSFGIVYFSGSLSRIADIDFLQSFKSRNYNSADSHPSSDSPKDSSLENSSFKSMISIMTDVLKNQVVAYDTKASSLLDKGIFYAGAGIVFFLISILAWQWVFKVYGFRNEHLYGIVSCGSLFVAVEVISAWFLKQYRNYVDGSTELLKIKAIFDKMLLLKLASEESTTSGSMDAKLAETLSQDIVWPQRPVVGKANVDLKIISEVLSNLQKIVKDAKS